MANLARIQRSAPAARGRATAPLQSRLSSSTGKQEAISGERSTSGNSAISSVRGEIGGDREQEHYTRKALSIDDSLPEAARRWPRRSRVERLRLRSCGARIQASTCARSPEQSCKTTSGDLTDGAAGTTNASASSSHLCGAEQLARSRQDHRHQWRDGKYEHRIGTTKWSAKLLSRGRIDTRPCGLQPHREPTKLRHCSVALEVDELSDAR